MSGDFTYMHKKRHSAWLIGSVLFLSAARLLACVCDQTPRTPKQKLQEFDAVFRGTVINIGFQTNSLEDTFGMKQVLFRVDETWKGSNVTSRIIYTGQGTGDCGYPFVQGRSYLVYANQLTSTNQFPTNLVTNICSGTLPEKLAANAVKTLGAGQKPEAK